MRRQSNFRLSLVGKALLAAIAKSLGLTSSAALEVIIREAAKKTRYQMITRETILGYSRAKERQREIYGTLDPKAVKRYEAYATVIPGEPMSAANGTDMVLNPFAPWIVETVR